MAAGTFMFAACDDNAIFEKEMYKNEVALISSDYHNTFQEIVHLTGEEVVGYIAASSGGTHAPEKDLVIGLEHDLTPLSMYNYALYDADETKYARELQADKYEIADYQIIIPAGERTGRTRIVLRPDGLSPDSAYFIGLRATDLSGVELNPKKNTMLFQVMIENAYASQAKNSLYTMTGLMNGMVTAANKQLFPLTHNSVRMIAGNETFISTEEELERTSIILEVSEDNQVTIRPYGNLDVQQIDGDPQYPNIFKVEEAYGMRTNVFLLSYQYTLDSNTKIMKERVEIQIR